ncbi:MAG: efflux RND transporter periplasmic adaptor subunit [Blastocatellia bacterium]|nr:efflux RND transporter periplasmic adaptor subunit [Blastocatellia bacterium]MCS7158010.1 efflux RND transporter periplasmic adaptor subunit [Blastocatellia bacterium]MCX7752517.1 efflux RND transporter periplasmic adaptor subunit [Blastocatellia bacterium]MDW8167368.1 efflux RND transporter periplasmic adaptor subunit [Acidobacteriota bacterium]MDW8257307.1 efflux RND transporter periplasmic adaptor subunit [Acidobacteriota bacterium]
MKRHPQRLLLLTSALALAAASCGQREEAAADRPPAVVKARVETVTKTPIEDVYEAVGTVRSRTTVVLSAKVVGHVLAVLVREGDRVRSGQVLVQLDDREAQAQVRKAEAGWREAENAREEIERAIRAAESAREAARAHADLAAATFRRYEALLERRSVSAQEFDEVRARYRAAMAEVERADELLRSLRAKREQVAAKIEQARADLTAAQVALTHTRVTAPITGLVTAKSIEVGMLATPGTPLLTIEDDTRYRLEVTVPESQIAAVRLGDAVPVEIDALGSSPLLGRVAEIIPAADPMSRSYTVKVDLPTDRAAALRSGLYGKARFRIGQRRAITIPRAAVLERGQLIGVYVVEDSNQVRFRLITLGKVHGDRVEVLSGLTEGERIVAENPHVVREGSRVQP